jgi:micrococcal nuclease
VETVKKVVIGIIILASFILNGYFFYSKNREMTVTAVHDGDTFTLGSGERVRLLGINAPEIGNCGATESASLLTSLVLGKVIKITEDKRDAYGRRMGLVWSIGLTSSVLVNEEMIKEGWAKPNYDANSQSEKLKAAYEYAKENNLGVNSDLCKKVNPTPPNKTCVIKGNIDKGTGEKFYHLPSCRHYNQIVLDLDIGEGFFCSEKEAGEAGFKLATDCLKK